MTRIHIRIKIDADPKHRYLLRPQLQSVFFVCVGVCPAVVPPGAGGGHLGAVRHHRGPGGQTKPASLGRQGKYIASQL